jgi:hypothetical protein
MAVVALKVIVAGGLSVTVMFERGVSPLFVTVPWKVMGLP